MGTYKLLRSEQLEFRSHLRLAELSSAYAENNAVVAIRQQGEAVYNEEVEVAESAVAVRDLLASSEPAVFVSHGNHDLVVSNFNFEVNVFVITFFTRL